MLHFSLKHIFLTNDKDILRKIQSEFKSFFMQIMI